MVSVPRLMFLTSTIVVMVSACQSTVTSTPGPTAAATETDRAPATVRPTSVVLPTSSPTVPPLAATTATEPRTPTLASTTANEPDTPTPAAEQRGNADVVYVRAVRANTGAWTFHVTVQHPDTGWEDYADGWDVVTPDGTVLKPDPDSPFTRLLLHPHETEQPFTRSQSGIVIPDGVTQVRVRAHDLVDGYGGKEISVDLTASSGLDFEVQR